jgi:hypothetical protein
VKASGIFVSAILVIDTFLVAYAVGFNSRHVLMVDPTMKPVAAKPAPAEQDKTEKIKATAEDKSAAKGTTEKSSHKASTKTSKSETATKKSSDKRHKHNSSKSDDSKQH